ncbi:hypothetical protein KUTG_09446 [Kutzneria sp. 744]|nr:hypothetical protein KUTG_09446 [Kutzneria sp. 744]
MAENKGATRPAIRPIELFAGALAAVTAAFLGSLFGVAGTVIGAALASLVSAVGAAVYQRSLDRAWQSLWSRLAAPPRSGSGDAAGRAVPDEHSSLATPQPINPPTSSGRHKHRWLPLIVAAVAMFVLGMAVLTGVELLHGGPISGGNAGTTIGGLFGRPTQRPTQTRAPESTSTTPRPTSPTQTTTTQVNSPPTASTTTTTSTSTTLSTTSSGSTVTPPTDMATSTPTEGSHP